MFIAVFLIISRVRADLLHFHCGHDGSAFCNHLAVKEGGGESRGGGGGDASLSGQVGVSELQQWGIKHFFLDTISCLFSSCPYCSVWAYHLFSDITSGWFYTTGKRKRQLPWPFYCETQYSSQDNIRTISSTHVRQQCEWSKRMVSG